MIIVGLESGTIPISAHKISVALSMMFWKWGVGKERKRREKGRETLRVNYLSSIKIYSSRYCARHCRSSEQGQEEWRKKHERNKTSRWNTHTVAHTITINGARDRPEIPVNVTIHSKWILCPPSIREVGPKNINRYFYQFLCLLKSKGFYIKRSPRFSENFCLWK